MSIIDQGQTVRYNKLVFRFNIISAHTEGEYPEVYVQIYYEDKPPPITSEGFLLPKNKDYPFSVTDLENSLYARGYINYNIYEGGAGIWGYFHYDYEQEYADCVNLLTLSEKHHPIVPPPEPISRELIKESPPEGIIIQNVDFFDLFQFTGLRRPGKIPKQDSYRYILCQNSTKFYKSLLEAAKKQEKAKLKSLSEAYLQSPTFTKTINPIQDHIFALIELYEFLLAHNGKVNEGGFMDKIEDSFSKFLEPPIKPSEFDTLKETCINGLNASMILYKESEIEQLEVLILLTRLCEWAIRSLNQEKPERIYAALKAIIILPNEIFDLLYPNSPQIEKNDLQGYVRPLGIGELMTVREKPIGYEAGEIARIENVMKHSYHEISETDRILQTEGNIQSRLDIENQDFNLRQDENYDLGQALSNNAGGLEESFLYTSGDKKEDTDGASGGLTKKYSNDEEVLSGGWTIDIKPNGDYTSQAIRFAKNITGKVNRKMRQRRKSSEHFEVQKEKAVLNKRIYDNKEKGENITAIYRWVNKISEAKLINIGHRLIIEFVVPNPAEDYIGKNKENLRPIAPSEELIKNLSYTDMTPELYRELASHYPVEKVISPPQAFHYVSTSLHMHPLSLQSMVQIPKGYYASKAYVSAVFGKGEIEGFIGNTSFSTKKTEEKTPSNTQTQSSKKATKNENEPTYQALPPEVPTEIQSFKTELSLLPTNTKSDKEKKNAIVTPFYFIDESIPLSLLSTSSFFNVNIDILCKLKTDRMKEWQLRAYRSIIEAYEKQEKRDTFSYQEKQDRREERQIVIDQLINASAEQLIKLIDPQDTSWEKDNLQRLIRQAFLWEEMVYWLYDHAPNEKPRESIDWANDYQQSDQLPDFNQFLHAKSAKIHVAVKSGFEQDALFLIWTQGKEWLGLNTDAPIKEQYLFYANELLFDTSDEMPEEKEIKNWKIKTPTQMQILQADCKLPDFD